LHRPYSLKMFESGPARAVRLATVRGSTKLNYRKRSAICWSRGTDRSPNRVRKVSIGGTYGDRELERLMPGGDGRASHRGANGRKVAMVNTVHTYTTGGPRAEETGGGASPGQGKKVVPGSRRGLKGEGVNRRVPDPSNREPEKDPTRYGKTPSHQKPDASAKAVL